MRWLVLLLALGMVAAGCSGDDDDTASGAGSTTVAPAATVTESAAVTTVKELEAATTAGPLTTAPANPATAVRVTVDGLSGYNGADLAGVLHRDTDGTVVGGFAVEIDGDPFTTTQLVRPPAEPENLQGPWPYLAADEVAVVEPGTYALMLWVDTSLEGYGRWLPINTDGKGLAGCVYVFEVVDENAADVRDVVIDGTVDGQISSNGYFGACESHGPFPSLVWRTETSGETWTATVWAVAFVSGYASEEFSMTARFALPGEPPGPDEPGECNRNPDNEYAWECEWTSPELDKKTAESVIFEVIDPPEPACGPIEINRGEGGPFFCDSTP